MVGALWRRNCACGCFVNGDCKSSYGRFSESERAAQIADSAIRRRSGDLGRSVISVVLGRRGCGKTTLIKGRVASKPRLLIFDTLAEYGTVGTAFRDIEPFVDYVEKRQFLQFNAIYQPVDKDLFEAFSDFCRVGWIVGDCVMVVDEVDQISSATVVPPELAKNLRYGRHRKISVIAASRRAADVPRLITSQADELISFNQTEPRDLKYIEEYAGQDFARRTLTLPRYKALIYRSFEGTISEQISNSPNETNVQLRVFKPTAQGDPAPEDPTPTESDEANQT